MNTLLKLILIVTLTFATVSVAIQKSKLINNLILNKNPLILLASMQMIITIIILPIHIILK